MPIKKSPVTKSSKPAEEPYVIKNRTLSFDFAAEPEPRAVVSSKTVKPDKSVKPKSVPAAVAAPSKTPSAKKPSAPVGADTAPKDKSSAGKSVGDKTAGAKPVGTKLSGAKAAKEKQIRQVTPASQRLAPPAVVASPATTDGPKVRRSRVPADLSQQYGEKISSRLTKPVPVVETEVKARRKRTTATEREDRKRQLAPDAGLLARLSKINSLPLAPVKKEPRASGWKFQCGRCGTSTRFETPAGLCPGCGAIALKDR